MPYWNFLFFLALRLRKSQAYLENAFSLPPSHFSKSILPNTSLLMEAGTFLKENNLIVHEIIKATSATVQETLESGLKVLNV